MDFERRRCRGIRDFDMIFVDFLDDDDSKKHIEFCCLQPNEDLPGIPLASTGKETMENFQKLHKNIVYELMNLPPENRSTELKNCYKCPLFSSNMDAIGTDFKEHISYINIGVYPSACQAKCIYCSAFYQNNIFTPTVNRKYNILFDTIEYGLKSGIILNDVEWYIASGDITAHPFKNRIFDIVGNNKACWLTNCFQYDGMISKNLKSNPSSIINLSIDCSTSATWRTIKGSDNFNTMIKNLYKYQEHCTSKGQITLKYIMLPGVNNSLREYKGLVDILKILGLNYIQIDTDRRFNVNYFTQNVVKEEYLKNTIEAIGTLQAVLMKNNISFNQPFSDSEQNHTSISFATELLKQGKV